MLVMPQAGLSQVVSSQIISDDTIEALDEIVVYGQPTLRLLRDEVYEAEEHFYDLWNALNDGRQFDVRCFYRKLVGSHIRRRTCEAYFVKSPPSGVPHWAFVRHKSRQMLREMEALVVERAELHAALMEFADAKQIFDSSLRSRCIDRLSICRD